jgi:hypothetical protein
MLILTCSYIPICSESQVLESNIGNSPTQFKSHLAGTGKFHFIYDTIIHVRNRQILIALFLRSDPFGFATAYVHYH